MSIDNVVMIVHADILNLLKTKVTNCLMLLVTCTTFLNYIISLLNMLAQGCLVMLCLK